ncbi:MAG: MATE family efflux transporter [Proteobacteria bacterium]|nr:MATE family efflux transporter [Pseudomonadota bacterium]
MNKKAVFSYFYDIKSLLILALPLMLMQFFGYSIGMIDVMMVGHIDESNLAGLALAVSVHSVIFLLFSSFGVPVLSNISKLYAEERFSDIRAYFQQFLYCCVIVGIVLTVFFMNSDFIFSQLNIQDKTKDIASDYLNILGTVTVFGCVSSGLKNLMRAFAKNKVLLTVVIAGMPINILLNYVLIFGIDGVVPAMHARGSAISSAFIIVVDFIICLVYCMRHEEMNPFKNFVKIKWRSIKKIFAAGIPVSAGLVMETGLFSTLTFMCAKYGETTIGGHQVALNFRGVIYMLYFGLSMAVVQRIAFLRGLKRDDEIKHTILSAAGLSLLLSFITINITLFFRKEIASLYSNDESVVVIAMQILLIYATFQAFDGLRIIGLAIMRAYNLNKEAAKFAFFCYWCVGFVSGVILSRFYGVFGYWMGLVLCFMILTYCFYSKIYHGFLEKPKTKIKLVFDV